MSGQDKMSKVTIPFTAAPATSEVENRLSQAYLDFLRNLARLEKFRIVALGGLGQGLSAIENWYLETFRDLLSSTTSFGPFTPEVEVFIRQNVKNIHRTDTLASIHIACLVMAHAAFEALLHSLLRLLPLTHRVPLLERIRNKKIPVSSAISGTLEQELSKLLCDHVEQITRESLKNKLDLLIDICSFDANCQPENFRFDHARLIAIDRSRQEALHVHLYKELPETPDSSIDYLRASGQFLTCLFSRSAGLQVSVLSILQDLGVKPPST
jgi:hypothetical protein